MNPIMLAWMQHSWVEDYNEDWKLLENNGYLVGSFINPEAVKKALGHGAEKFVSTDEEFDKSVELMKKMGEEFDQTQPRISKKRKRKYKR